jgi:hypothetical protein
MNERIGKLAEEAGLLGPGSRVGDAHNAAERFAELIIQKCLYMIENEASTYAEPIWAVELVNDIREHFGVEE